MASSMRDMLPGFDDKRRKELIPREWRDYALYELLQAEPAVRNHFIFNLMTYNEAWQLCHATGIKHIKGNCRKVLERRLRRIVELPQNEYMKQQLLRRCRRGKRQL